MDGQGFCRSIWRQHGHPVRHVRAAKGQSASLYRSPPVEEAAHVLASQAPFSGRGGLTSGFATRPYSRGVFSYRSGVSRRRNTPSVRT